MTRKTPIQCTIAALLIAATAGAAHAGDGFYAGGGAGQVFVDETEYDDEDLAVSLFGGYQFNRYFAIEGGYLDLGEIESGLNGASLEADTLYITAVGMLPVNDAFAVYAKAGMHSWDADTSLAILGGEDSGSDPTYGIGAQYCFTDNFALRAEFNRFEMEDADTDVALLQARFDF
jgi:OOP family OmpA-OmpF porin